jgi:cell division protein FtsQ
MKIKRHIKKIVWLSLSTSMVVGLLLLLMAAITKQSQKLCAGVDIQISGNQGQSFLNKQMVLSLMSPAKPMVIKGKPQTSFDLHLLENKLEQHAWVKDAELFFDHNNLLRINIKESVPLARIFTRSGESFYIDSSGRLLPLHENVCMKIPVFTGYPNNSIKAADSALINQIKLIGNYLLANSFWRAQITQVHITNDQLFELTPLIGNHTVQLGNGIGLAEKLHRLFLFYQQVSTIAGIDKYSVINVQYAQQVVATKKRGNDTLANNTKAVTALQPLIAAAQKNEVDSTISTLVDNNIALHKITDSTLPVLKRKNFSVTKKNSLKILKPTTNYSYPSNSKLVVVPIQNKKT